MIVRRKGEIIGKTARENFGGGNGGVGWVGRDDCSQDRFGLRRTDPFQRAIWPLANWGSTAECEMGNWGSWSLRRQK